MRNKKIFSAVISIAMCLSMLPITVNAENNDDIFTDSIADTYNSYNVWGELEEDNNPDENDTSDYEVEYANVFQEDNHYILGNEWISTYGAINGWTIGPRKISKLPTTYFLDVGDKFDFDFTISPAMDTSELKIGIYNADTDTPTYLKHTTTELKGTYTISKAGNYNVIVTNYSSNTTAIISGKYDIIRYVNHSVSVNHISQGTNWCWAASIEMSAKALGYKTYTQNDIVKHVKGSETHAVGGYERDFPDGMEYATKNIYTTSLVRSALSSAEIIAELDAGRPIITDWVNSTATARHAKVLSGYNNTTDYLRFIDPDPNKEKPQFYTYSEAVTNTNAKWDKTYKITKK